MDFIIPGLLREHFWPSGIADRNSPERESERERERKREREGWHLEKQNK
jgi:hypothetical protein